MAEPFVNNESTPVSTPSGGVKNQKLARFDLIPPDAMYHLAEHYGKGAAKYGDRNWELGIPYALAYAAAMRHLHQWFGGEDKDAETDSSHLCGALFALLTLLHFELNKEHYAQFDDRPMISRFRSENGTSIEGKVVNESNVVEQLEFDFQGSTT